MIVDTILDDHARPVWSKEPAEVLRRLRHPYPANWTHVYIGAAQQTVTIADYLYGEKHAMVVKELKELVSRKDLSMYRRDPSRWDEHVERIALRLIERILDK